MGPIFTYRTRKRIVQYQLLTGFCNIDKKDRGYVIRLLGGEYDYNGKIVDGVEMGFMSKFWK